MIDPWPVVRDYGRCTAEDLLADGWTRRGDWSGEYSWHPNDPLRAALRGQLIALVALVFS